MIFLALFFCHSVGGLVAKFRTILPAAFLASGLLNYGYSFTDRVEQPAEALTASSITRKQNVYILFLDALTNREGLRELFQTDESPYLKIL